jgi:hypothetical protein
MTSASGNLLIRCRIALGLTQQELGTLLGIAPHGSF